MRKILLVTSTVFMVSIMSFACNVRRQSYLSEVTRDFSSQDFGQLKGFLNKYCAECHSAESGAGGLDFIDDLSRLRSSTLVVPNDPSSSQLWQRVVGLRSDVNSRMPPDYADQQIADESEIDIITKWIAAGAPSDEASGAREIVSDGKVLRLIADDLARLSPAQRPATRYLSLTNLYNTIKDNEYAVSDSRLAAYRFGISKFVNSLSWTTKVTPPEVVAGSNGTLLRLDLRNYAAVAKDVGLTHLPPHRPVGLTAEAWEKLSALDPYRIDYKDGLMTQIRLQTSTTSPVMRADFFIFKAGVGDLYYEILGIEGNLSGLEKSLLGGLTTSDRIRQRQPIIRSGFTNSGVSKHNRMIERHDINLYRNAAYWISYDFEGTVGRQQLATNPLGPQSAFDSENRVFRHDGGEVIFHLPNGLFGFVLTTADGKLLTDGPVNIVQDPKRTVVKNAISCMDCHSVGMIKKTDQIRAIAEANRDVFDQAQLDFVRYAYPRNDYAKNLLDTLFNRDTDRFQAAVAASALSGESVGNDRFEPVSALHDYFFDTEVTLAMAAAEVGLSEQDFVAAIQRRPNLRIVLSNFFIQGGRSVKRETFKDLFPQIVRELELDQVAERLDSNGSALGGDSAGSGRADCRVEIFKSGNDYRRVLEHSASPLARCQKEVLEQCNRLIESIRAHGYECRIIP